MRALMRVGMSEYAVDLQPTRDCRNYLAVWTQRGLVRVSQGATPTEALAAAESDARAIEAYRGEEIVVAVRATRVRDLDGFNGNAALYRLSEAIPFRGDDKSDGTTEYVVASAVVAPYTGAEVLVFPASESGEVISWGEVAGMRGTMDHAEAMRSAGWEVAS